MTHIMAKGHVSKSNPVCSWVVRNVASVKDPLSSSTDRMMTGMTSYEIVLNPILLPEAGTFLEVMVPPSNQCLSVFNT